MSNQVLLSIGKKILEIPEDVTNIVFKKNQLVKEITTLGRLPDGKFLVAEYDNSNNIVGLEIN